MPREPYWSRHSRRQITRLQESIQKDRDTIAHLERKLTKADTLGKQFDIRQRIDFLNLSSKYTAIRLKMFTAIASREDHEEAIHRLEALTTEEMAEGSKIFYEGYLWLAEQYENAGKKGLATKARHNAERFK